MKMKSLINSSLISLSLQHIISKSILIVIYKKIWRNFSSHVANGKQISWRKMSGWKPLIKGHCKCLNLAGGTYVTKVGNQLLPLQPLVAIQISADFQFILTEQ